MSALAAVAIGFFAAVGTGLGLGGLRQNARSRRVDRLHAVRSRLRRLREWVRQSGWRITAGQLALVSLVTGGVMFVLVGALTSTPIVGVVPSAAVAAVPWSWCAHARRGRLRRVQAAWPDGLRDVLAAVTAGRSLAQALGDLAVTGPVALREAFVGFPQLSRVLGTVPALELIREQLSDATTDRVIEVVVVAHERGGSVVRDVLSDLVADTTKDVKVLEEIETDGLEMRINTRAVLVLPWLVLVALTVRPGPFRAFYTSHAGALVVVAGGALGAVGAAWVHRLGRSMDEERVLGGARVSQRA